MKSGLNKVITLADGSSWLVAAETNFENNKYEYLIRLTEDKEDIVNEFRIVKIFLKDDKEYMDMVTDKKLLNDIALLLVPEAKEFIANPEVALNYFEETN